VNPRLQLRCAVALQVGQLNRLTSALETFLDLMRTAGNDWRDWAGQSAALLEDLSLAKRQQEELLQTLKQGWTAVKDADTARIEAALRSLVSVIQELRTATETVTGTGKGFQAQVQSTLQGLEPGVQGAVDQAARKLEEPVLHFRRSVRRFTWIGGTLGVLMTADVLIRVLK
jgi:hypothetical protein